MLTCWYIGKYDLFKPIQISRSNIHDIIAKYINKIINLKYNLLKLLLSSRAKEKCKYFSRQNICPNLIPKNEITFD